MLILRVREKTCVLGGIDFSCMKYLLCENYVCVSVCVCVKGVSVKNGV